MVSDIEMMLGNDHRVHAFRVLLVTHAAIGSPVRCDRRNVIKVTPNNTGINSINLRTI